MRKNLPMGKAEAHDPALHMEMEVLRAEREERLEAEEVQTAREQEIAVAYEEAGKIKALTFCEKVATVATYVRLQYIKENELYKPFGTWDKYCDYIGLKRRTVDEELQKLAILGESFLATCRQFNMSHRDIKTICLVKKEGTIQIDDNTITIGKESIPIDADHADELHAAIEKIIEQNSTLNTRVAKLEKHLDAAVKEETKALKAEKDALNKEYQRMKVLMPEEHDREWSIELMALIRKDCDAFCLGISKFILDPRMKEDRQLQTQINAHIHEAELTLKDLRDRFEAEYDIYGA